MMTKPDWTAIATAPLPTEEQAAVRFDAAADNFLAAFLRAVEALEDGDFPELADQLCESFSRAVSAKGNRDE